MTSRKTPEGSGRNDPHNIQIAPPVVRVTRVGPIDIYPISGTELNILAEGSTGSLFLNFALALLPISITLLVTLITVSVTPIHLFVVFVVVCVVTFIAGLVLLALWWRVHISSRRLIEEIRSRMPPQPAVHDESIPRDNP